MGPLWDDGCPSRGRESTRSQEAVVGRGMEGGGGILEIREGKGHAS